MLLSTYVLAFTAVLTLAYIILIQVYTYWFRKLKPFKAALTFPSTKFSVVIPARDEESSVTKCIESIINGTYPAELYEIIVVDDHSTDNTAKIVKQLSQKYSNVKLLQLAEVLQNQKLNAYKKKAVETGIAHAQNDWIVTTDADCILPDKWLNNFDSYIQQHNDVWIAAPVRFKTKKTWISIFQSLDFLSLQGITAASVSAGVNVMCNGANLCYRKNVFYEAGGFTGIDNVASGDDMLLMKKIQNLYPHNIGYLFSKSSVVLTASMPDWKSFINQRIRWASKSTQYKDKKIFAVLLLVYFFNLMLLILPFFSFLDIHILLYWLLFVGVKILAEIRFMYHITAFFKQRGLLKYFPFMQPIHIVYTVIAGWLGKFGSYQWKGRHVK